MLHRVLMVGWSLQATSTESSKRFDVIFASTIARREVCSSHRWSAQTCERHQRHRSTQVQDFMFGSCISRNCAYCARAGAGFGRRLARHAGAQEFRQTLAALQGVMGELAAKTVYNSGSGGGGLFSAPHPATVSATLLGWGRSLAWGAAKAAASAVAAADSAAVAVSRRLLVGEVRPPVTSCSFAPASRGAARASPLLRTAALCHLAPAAGQPGFPGAPCDTGYWRFKTCLLAPT